MTADTVKVCGGKNAEEVAWTINCARGMENQNQPRYVGLKTTLNPVAYIRSRTLECLRYGMDERW